MTVAVVSCSSSSVWHGFKDLEQAVLTSPPHHLPRLIDQYREQLIEPLKNQYTKNANSKNRIENGAKTAIDTDEGPKLLPQNLIDETLIISDLYNLDEIKTLELLWSAENYQPQNPGLTRGLVAVLFYWDGRRALINSLKTLLFQHCGTAQFGSILELLQREQILSKLIDSYTKLSVEGELAKLASQRGLGDARHRRDIREQVQDCKTGLAESIFLLSHLDSFDPLPVLEKIKTIEKDAKGTLSSSDTIFIFAFVNYLSIELKDDYDSLSEIALLDKPNLVEDLHTAIMADNFKTAELGGLIRLVWSITLRALSQLPGLPLSAANIIEQDDSCLEKSLSNGVFDFLSKLIESEALGDDVLVQLVHKMLTDLIVLMPLKIKELRKAPEPAFYLSFLQAISAFYQTNGDKSLHDEFWQAELNENQSTHRSLALHDFLRIDIVPALLYTATVKMIKSLSTGESGSKACFKLLKQATGNLSWERIFDSLRQYCDGLLAEMGSNSSITGMSPQETEAMVEVVDLIGRVATFDAQARQIMLEQQSWRAPLYLMQILRCPVAPELKAAALRSLTSLIGSPESAASLWCSIESDQLLDGMKKELNLTESQLEKYPLTQSFAKLLNHLFTFPLPLTLGAGTRKSGLDPFLDYLISDVLLKSSVRPYKEPNEKLKLELLILQTIKQLAVDYIPNPEYFSADSSIHPGHHVYRFLMMDSHFLRHLLAIVAQATDHLETFPAQPNKALLELCLEALSLIHLGLANSDEYLNACRDAPDASLLLTPTHQLLRSINRQTGRADHVLNIAKIIRHAQRHIDLSLSSLKILRFLSQKTPPKDFLVLVLSSETTQRDELLRGFWELLELTGEETLSCRLELLKLLLQSVDCRSVSLTHFLLGFPLQSTMSRVSLQDPGVLNSPKTTLHSLLWLLSDKDLRQDNRELVELGYELIYKLCQNDETSGPALRYLRSSHDFIYRQLNDLELPNTEVDALYLKTHGWLLKLVALELHVTTQQKQRSNQLRLVKLLFQRTSHTMGTGQSMSTTILQEMTMLHGDTTSSLLITDVFRQVNLSATFPDAPRTELLDMGVIQQLASKCTNDNQVDLIKLHHLIKIELAPQVDGAANLLELETEVKFVLRWIQQSNHQNELIKSKLLFLTGWRQLIEICLSGPVELLPPECRAQLLQEIFGSMLKEIRRPESSTTLTSTLSTVGLSLMTQLRIALKQQEEPALNSISMLDGSMIDAVSAKIMPSSSTLPQIGEGIIEWAVSSRNQKVRAHLYTALLNYIHLQPDSYSKESPDLTIDVTLNESDVSNLTLGGSGGVNSAQSATRILRKYGTSIMSITCQDAIDGHHVTRTLAFTLLDSIMRRDNDRTWLQFMSNKGYLKHILASIELEDSALIQSLTTTQQYAYVYVHESRMAMLNTLARSRQGARALLDNGLIMKLSSAKFISSRPNIQVSSDDPGDKARQHRYRLLIFPVMRLINTLQTTLADRITALQVMHFAISHLDALLAPLNSNCMEPSKELESLEEVHLITSLLCLVAAHDFRAAIDETGDEQLSRNYSLHQTKIKRALFGAFPIYILSEKWIKNASGAAYLEAQRIATNLTEAARQVILNAVYNNETQVVFSLKLTDETAHGGEDPPLGILINMLKTTCANFGLAVQEQVSIAHKLANITGLPTLELDILSSEDNDDNESEGHDLHQKQMIAKRTLEKKNKIQQKLLTVQHQQLENVLFILWRHVEYYLTRAPTKTRGILFGSDDTQIIDQSVSFGDLNTFRTSLRSRLTESLLRRVIDQEAQYLKVNDCNDIKQFIQPITYRLSKTIELSTK